MADQEKLYTLDDVKASTHEAESARYRFTACVYKTLKEELGEEKANELLYKSYFRYGHYKHQGAEVIPGDLEHFCDTYARGEHSYFPYSMEMPYKVEGDTAQINWCIGGCGGLKWFAEGGITPEEANALCWNAAVAGDIGYADKCGLDAYFTHTCATGACDCEFIIKKRK